MTERQLRYRPILSDGTIFASQLSRKGPNSVAGTRPKIHKPISSTGFIVLKNMKTKTIGIHVIVLMAAIMTTVLFIGVFPSTREGTLISNAAKTRLVTVLRSATADPLAPAAMIEGD